MNGGMSALAAVNARYEYIRKKQAFHLAKITFRQMVSGVSKDPSSVAVATETIASVRAEKDLVIAALQAHSALLTK